MAIPDQMRFGYLRGIIVRPILDTFSDPDSAADLTAVRGQVLIESRNPFALGREPKTVLTKARIAFDIDGDGRLLNPITRFSGPHGFPVGDYVARFKLENGDTLPDMRFTISEAHTPDDPLDLFDVASAWTPGAVGQAWGSVISFDIDGVPFVDLVSGVATVAADSDGTPYVL